MDIPIEHRTILPANTFAAEVELKCPGCGSEYLHHYEVRIYSRDEDAAKVEQITARALPGGTPQALLETTSGNGNPSSRRHGIAVRFDCEMCSQISELTLAQHKGTTMIGWRRVGFALTEKM
jgi:hypothetical protein